MKAEERHELKTNELAQWILNLPQLLKQNLQAVIYVSAAIVLILAVIFYYTYQRETTTTKNEVNLTKLIGMLGQQKIQIIKAQSQGMDSSYNLIQTADELDVTAQNVKSDNAEALALIKRGEALRTELHYRPGIVSKEALTSQISLAEDSYKKAVDKAQGDPSLTAQAMYGMGLCKEEIGDFAAAAKIYRQIIDNTGLEGTVGVAQAKYRLSIMADYEKPITFRPAPKPAAAPAAPLAPEVNAPAMQTSPAQGPRVGPLK